MTRDDIITEVKIIRQLADDGNSIIADAHKFVLCSAFLDAIIHDTVKGDLKAATMLVAGAMKL